MTWIQDREVGKLLSDAQSTNGTSTQVTPRRPDVVQHSPQSRLASDHLPIRNAPLLP